MSLENFSKNCKIDRGLCLVHGYSVSKQVPCPVYDRKVKEIMEAFQVSRIEAEYSLFVKEVRNK